MDLFGFARKKAEEKSEAELILEGADSNEIVVPNHAKQQEENFEKKSVSSKKNLFVISNVYDIGTQVMVSGTVENGVLTKKLRTKIKDKDIPISDLKLGSASVKELSAGSSGTVFLRGKDLHMLRAGDVLEFKEKK